MSSYGFELLQCGYRFRPPSPTVADIDALIAERTPCPKCGGQMHYEGYTNERGSYIALSYIALTVCNKCGHEEEF